MTRGLTQPGLDKSLTFDPSRFIELLHVTNSTSLMLCLFYRCTFSFLLQIRSQKATIIYKNLLRLLRQIPTNSDSHLGATNGSWEVVPGFFPLSTQAGVSKNDPEGPVPAKPAGNQQDFPFGPRASFLDILDELTL